MLWERVVLFKPEENKIYMSFLKNSKISYYKTEIFLSTEIFLTLDKKI